MTTVVFLTIASSSPWTVPGDWDNAANTIEGLGSGGQGYTEGFGNGAGGGGGGAYAKAVNVTLSGTVAFVVGA